MLKLGLGVGGVALVIAGVGAFTVWPRAAAAGRRALSGDDEELVRALAEVYMPRGSALDLPEIDVVSGVDTYAAILPPTEGKLLRALFRAVDQLPRVMLSSRSRFTELSAEERVALMTRLEKGGRTQVELCTLLRLVIGVALFRDARTFAALGLSWGCPVIP
jgi:hypothetical protein